jgi:hypothetical protein
LFDLGEELLLLEINFDVQGAMRRFLEKKNRFKIIRKKYLST